MLLSLASSFVRSRSSQLLRPAATSSLVARALSSGVLAAAPARRVLIGDDSRSSSDASAQTIAITDRCVQRILQLNKGDEQTAERLLRLSVEPGGCSGFSYRFELEDATEIDEGEDLVFEREGARVVVDDASLELLAGATIDFEDEMMKSAFIVAANPQSSASCGCGTSFQAKE